jgi:hypothetical protein
VSPRSYWKGYLKLSLVSCPIALHAACASSERISFRQINRKTGNRLRQQLVDEETREAVDGHEKARGYEIGKGEFLLVEDEELEAIEIESTHTIDIDSFVPRSDLGSFVSFRGLLGQAPSTNVRSKSSPSMPVKAGPAMSPPTSPARSTRTFTMTMNSRLRCASFSIAPCRRAPTPAWDRRCRNGLSHEQSDATAGALRRLHPQIDRA